MIVAKGVGSELDGLITKLLETDKAFLKLAGDIDAVSKKGANVKSIKDYVTHTQKATEVNNKLRLSEIKTEQAREKAMDKYTASLKKQQSQREAQVNKESQLRQSLARQRAREEKAAETANKKRLASEKRLSSEYQKLATKVSTTGNAVKNLIAKRERLGKLSVKEDAQLKRLSASYNKYRTSINRADHAIQNHQRNVGNYKTALAGMGISLRSLVSAFGITSGVMIFASAVTRDDLTDLEDTIISVAGATVRTSNEVAKLAESLATLGKSKSEIKDLLKPVIDLSLGLNASALRTLQIHPHLHLNLTKDQ